MAMTAQDAGAAGEQVLRRFVSRQRALTDALRAAHPAITDWTLLLDVPRSGTVAVDSDEWTFQRHGAGARFVRRRGGTVVDVHSAFAHADEFDAWRLASYMRAGGEDDGGLLATLARSIRAGSSPTEADVERWLDALQRAGVIERVTGAPARFRLTSARPAE
jgi:hypothetical protein